MNYKETIEKQFFQVRIPLGSPHSLKSNNSKYPKKQNKLFLLSVFHFFFLIRILKGNLNSYSNKIIINIDKKRGAREQSDHQS